MKYIASLCLFLMASCVAARQNPAYYSTIDVQHYHFNVEVNDVNDTLSGTAMITVKYLKPATELLLDLINVKSATGKGMKVFAVRDGLNNLIYDHSNDKLKIKLFTPVAEGTIVTYTIRYKGIPADGLIISKNKYGRRTMFSDNWPNRARNWIPCIDHPSDKASVEFEVIAPEHYQVVSNGLMIEQTNLSDHRRLSHWKESEELPTKVMAIGIADFAVGFAGNAGNIPVYSWIFPEDRGNGFYDYSEAVDILPWFEKKIGPYAYQKLANVQSKTIFGGMENAGAIFYAESSVNGKHTTGSLLAHEIAHQWFGNAITEINWKHIWLSEGFATYMTNLYLESRYGTDTLKSMLKKQRDEVIAFSKTRHTPVIDSTVNDYMELLNTNSYQKGGWVLHMLRRKLGDVTFWKGISTYYDMYGGKNASTDDFRAVMEKVSKQDLRVFFKQWLQTEGQPKIEVSWSYDEAKATVTINVEQTGRIFDFPLEIGFNDKIQTVNVKAAKNTFTFPLKTKTTKVTLDPNVNLLFEVGMKK